MFFVPYVWDVIVGSLTTTTFEWTRNAIMVFPLNDEDNTTLTEDINGVEGGAADGAAGPDVNHTPDIV